LRGLAKASGIETPKVNINGIEELIADKAYHSGAVIERVKTYEVRSYIPEKQQPGQRNWAGKAEERQAVYQNRRRVRGEYGKSLLRRRGELVERSFAHCYDTGAMRRTHLRGHQNILKRQLIHVGAFNLSLILRQLPDAGTPREWKNRGRMLIWRFFVWLTCLKELNRRRNPAILLLSMFAPPTTPSNGVAGRAEIQVLTPRAASSPCSRRAKNLGDFRIGAATAFGMGQRRITIIVLCVHVRAAVN
jgi:hypothetical protein